MECNSQLTQITPEREYVNWQLKLRVTMIEDFHPENPDQVVFEWLPVKQGEKVWVMEKPGLGYALRDGVVERVIDHESVATVDGVRYRKSGGGNTIYYVSGLVLLFVLIGVVVYIRRNSR
jgi:hypothetical protein